MTAPRGGAARVLLVNPLSDGFGDGPLRKCPIPSLTIEVMGNFISPSDIETISSLFDELAKAFEVFHGRSRKRGEPAADDVPIGLA